MGNEREVSCIAHYISLHKTGISLILIRNLLERSFPTFKKNVSLATIAKLVRRAGYSYKRCEKDTGARNSNNILEQRKHICRKYA